MHIEKELLFTVMFTIPLLLTAQDSPDHAECLSARFFEEQESGAQVSSSVSLKPELRFTNKIVIGSGPLTYYYYHRGTAQNMEDAVAIAFSSKYVQAGFGRGQPDIARGIILGNTMMRMTADPVSNFRMSDLKVRIKNYAYYPSLAYIGSKIKHASLFLFRHDGTRCAAGEYKRKRFQCGAAYYHTEDPVTEFWMKLSGETLPATFNASVSRSGPNHLAADVLFRSGSLRWHAAAVHLFPSFTDHRGDSKWGAGLRPGSTALAAGHVFRAGRWKWKNVFYGIFHDDYLERRLMSDAEYKKKPFEVRLSYVRKFRGECSAERSHPYMMRWDSKRHDILKTRIKIAFPPSTFLDLQMQADLRYAEAHALLARITHRRNKRILRAQITVCNSANSVLYLLRPLSAASYGIRRVPQEFTRYVDLVYAFMLGPLRCSLLMCTEGIGAKMEMKL